jgi:hypothetical protein
MILNIKPYRSQKDDLIMMIERDGIERLHEICAMYMLPIVALATFCIEEEIGDKEELESLIERLKDVYGYKEIIG